MLVDVQRGYLPETYYEERRVFKRKPPLLQPSPYPNKIEVGGRRSFAILVKHSNNARLQDAYEWMSTHSYVQVRYVFCRDARRLTGNIAVEAYASAERAYVMVVFRAATVADEHTNQMLASHGDSRKGPCPPPVTGLLCKSGVNLQSVWQWLNLHHGRLAYLINEPLLHTTISVLPTTRFNRATQSFQYTIYNSNPQTAAGRRQDHSCETIDSALPVYERIPPSVHSSNTTIPPAYWDVVRAAASNTNASITHTFAQSMPMLDNIAELDIDASGTMHDAQQPMTSTSHWIPTTLSTSFRRSRLSARTNPEYHSHRRNWFARLLHI